MSRRTGGGSKPTRDLVLQQTARCRRLTFPALEVLLRADGLPVRGESVVPYNPQRGDALVVWAGVTPDLADALNLLREQGQIAYRQTTLDRVIRSVGPFVDLPVMTVAKSGHRRAKRAWLPVFIERGSRWWV